MTSGAGDDAAGGPMVVDPDTLDCLACGACCRSGHDGRLLVPPADLVRWRAIGREDLVHATQEGHFGMRAFATRHGGACVDLGTSSNDNACGIYDDRGTTCRLFQKGSRQCVELRRDAGVA